MRGTKQIVLILYDICSALEGTFDSPVKYTISYSWSYVFNIAFNELI